MSPPPTPMPPPIPGSGPQSSSGSSGGGPATSSGLGLSSGSLGGGSTPLPSGAPPAGPTGAGVARTTRAPAFGAAREQLAGLFGRARDTFDQRPQRERTLILVGGLTMVLFTFALTTFLVISKLDDMETHNSQVTDALRLLAKDGTAYRNRKRAEQSLDAVLSHTPPPLLKFVDEVATKTSLKIAESKELSALPRGEKYQSRGLEIKFREIDLPQLVSFLKEVEGSTHKIVVERLQVKPRYGQHEKLDVELTVVAFEKGEKKKPKTGGKGSKGSDSGSGRSGKGTP
jgi:hypothetical protein